MISVCERCGADLPDGPLGGAVTCVYCGARVERTVAMQAQPMPAAAPPPSAETSARAVTIFELLVREFGEGTGIPIDPQAAKRVKEASLRAARELQSMESTEVNLPFLAADATGPKHLARRVTRAEADGAVSPFAPISPRGAYAHPPVSRRESVEELAGRREGGTGSKVGCAIGLLGILAGILVPGYFWFRENVGLSPESIASVGAADQEGWMTLRADPPSPFERFDPVAAEAWALALARRWSPDARIDMIFVQAVRADGTVDASSHGDDVDDEPRVSYRIVSEAKRREAARALEVSTVRVKSGLMLDVHDGMIQALAQTERADDLDDDSRGAPPGTAATCGMAAVIAAMRAGGLPLRPSWSVAQSWDGHAWRWWINGTDIGGARPPRIDAATCAAAP